MTKFILLIVLILGSVKAMACVEASFEKVNCLYTDHTTQPTHFYKNVKFTKNSYQFTNDEGEEVSIKLPSIHSDEDNPNWKTYFSCDKLNRLVVEETLDGVSAKEYTTVNKEGYVSKGYLIGTDHDCVENESEADCNKKPYTVSVFKSEEICKVEK